MEKFYTVKGLFRWYFKDGNRTSKYEERVILVKAKSTADAIEKAQSEASEYCNLYSCALTIESLNIFFAYSLDMIKISDYGFIFDELDTCVEVFSQQYECELGVTDYLNKFYPEVENGHD